jgi:hypothetical protein
VLQSEEFQSQIVKRSASDGKANKEPAQTRGEIRE